MVTGSSTAPRTKSRRTKPRAEVDLDLELDPSLAEVAAAPVALRLLQQPVSALWAPRRHWITHDQGAAAGVGMNHIVLRPTVTVSEAAAEASWTRLATVWPNLELATAPKRTHVVATKMITATEAHADHTRAANTQTTRMMTAGAEPPGNIMMTTAPTEGSLAIHPAEGVADLATNQTPTWETHLMMRDAHGR